jgi:hypothetical protein
MREGGFAVSAHGAFAFRKTPDSKIFLERGDKEKNRRARQCPPARAGGGEGVRQVAGVFFHRPIEVWNMETETEGKILGRKEVWK